MKLYELTYLIRPDIDEKELETLSEKIKSFIKEKGGVLGKETSAIKKKLGSQIRKKSLAYLKNLDFQLEPERIKEVKKEIESEKNVLRFIFLNKIVPKAKPLIKTFSNITLKQPLTQKEKPKKKVELKEIEKKLEEILE